MGWQARANRGRPPTRRSEKTPSLSAFLRNRERVLWTTEEARLKQKILDMQRREQQTGTRAEQ